MAAHRVGGSDDGRASGKGAHDAGLGDGDGLLLHGLQQRLMLIGHLIKLVNAANALIACALSGQGVVWRVGKLHRKSRWRTEDERTGLECVVARTLFLEQGDRQARR